MKRKKTILPLSLLLLAMLLGCEPKNPPSSATSASAVSSTVPQTTPIPTSLPTVRMEDGAPKMKRYVNEEAGFSIEVPQVWKLEAATPPVLIHAVSPAWNPEDAFLENVYVVRKRVIMNTTLDNQLSYMRDNISTIAPEGSFEESSEFTVNGARCVWLLVNYKLNGVPVRSMRYYFLRDQDLFEITCTCEPSSLQAYRAPFDNIAKSFRFLK